MNRGKTARSIFILLTLLIFNTGISHGKDSIYWLEAVAPPFFIHDGVLKGQGYEDLITVILKKNMPEYNHEHMQATISRHYQQWKQGEPACSLAMFKTDERSKFVHYSIPSVFTLPPVLIIKQDRFAEFGGEKTISLADLLKSNKFVIGRSSKRSYGKSFDSVLDAHGNENNIFIYEGGELSSNLFKMLMADRIDALPGLPEEAMYLAETMGMRDKIMTISVEENLSDHDAMLTYVACSKTPWGKKTIERINQVLLEQRPTPQYRAAYERWLDPSSINTYRVMYKTIFLERVE